MTTNVESARQFFEDCETGKGWEGCQVYCHSDATFDSQTSVLADIASVKDYCEWMKNLLVPILWQHSPFSMEHKPAQEPCRSHRERHSC